MDYTLSNEIYQAKVNTSHYDYKLYIGLTIRMFKARYYVQMLLSQRLVK